MIFRLASALRLREPCCDAPVRYRMNRPEGRKRIKKRAQDQPEWWSGPERHLRGDDQAGEGGISADVPETLGLVRTF